MKLFTGLLLLLLIGFSMSCDSDSSVKQIQEIDLSNTIDSLISIDGFNGVIRISSDSTVLYEFTNGFADAELKIQLAPEDLFVIGSISKQITAVLVLKEFENGKINLNDPIGEYLPEINQSWSEAVTIHHLLTHTHGIVDINSPLEFKEGSQFKYSQFGYELLAKVLESVTHESFETLSMNYFKEIGLNNTFHPDSEQYDNLVQGIEQNEDGKYSASQESLKNYAAAGSFISNAKDLSKWNHLLYNDKLLNPETFELMQTDFSTREHPIFGSVQYGYGVLFNAG